MLPQKEHSEHFKCYTSQPSEILSFHYPFVHHPFLFADIISLVAAGYHPRKRGEWPLKHDHAMEVLHDFINLIKFSK